VAIAEGTIPPFLLLLKQDGIHWQRRRMTTKKQFGEPSFPAEEVADLKRSAVRKPNLALAASWIFGGILAVVVVASVLIAG
jgi:hypothetical protein